jgi:hypothetical protein
MRICFSPAAAFYNGIQSLDMAFYEYDTQGETVDVYVHVLVDVAGFKLSSLDGCGLLTPCTKLDKLSAGTGRNSNG